MSRSFDYVTIFGDNNKDVSFLPPVSANGTQLFSVSSVHAPIRRSREAPSIADARDLDHPTMYEEGDTLDAR